MSILSPITEPIGRWLRLGWRHFLSWRYLRSRLVNLISVGGVMAGVAVLIIVMSIMDGFQERVRRVTRGDLSDLTLTPRSAPEITVKDASGADLDTSGLGPLPPPLPPPGGEPSDPPPPAEEPERRRRPPAPRFAKLQENLPKIDKRVVAIAPQLEVPVGYFFKSGRRRGLRLGNQDLLLMQATGIDWELEKAVSDLQNTLLLASTKDAPFFEARAASQDRKTVLISRRFAERFLLRTRSQPGADADLEALGMLIGSDMPVHVLLPREDGTYAERTFNLIVSGIFDGQDVTQSETRLYLRLTDLREISGLPIEYQHVRVKLRDYDDAAAVKARLVQELPAGAFAVQTWEDMRSDFLQAVESEKVLLVIVLSFIILLGGFIILATLTLTVVEKTRDIGILAALGATRRGILSVFLWTGLWIGLLGSALGVWLGWWFTNNVDGVRSWVHGTFGVDIFPANIYRFRSIPTVWDWTSVMWIAFGAVLMAFFAGLIPALRAARLDPIKALRHE